MSGSAHAAAAIGAARAAAAALAAMAVLSCLAGPVSAIGDQRSGTSSGTFLKIAADPRGAAMGNAVVADAPGITALVWNPASLTTLGTMQLMASYTRWPGEIDYSYAALASYVGRFSGTVGLQIGHLGVVMEETTEANPTGTGENFGVRDWFLAGTYARRFTDRLSFGLTARLVREELGTEIGGPSSTNVLFDFGTLYYMDFLDLKLAFALQHFGPEFQPSGEYVSAATGAETSYEPFAPPTTFRLGVSGPIHRTEHTLIRGNVEMNHFSDADETLRVGTEFGFDDMFFVRAGYDIAADAMKFSAGAGFHTRFGFSTGDADYAFTDAGPLGVVHRVAIRIDL